MHDNRIHFHMRGPLTIVALVVGAITIGQTQSAPLSIDTKLQSQLKQVIPSAGSFSSKVLDPPHFKAFAPSPAAGQQAVAGIAFWTTEIEPLERGYDGPIKILVGMDMQGILTGIVVAQHHEPYGDFSIETPQFAAQFKGKSVRDGFRVGADIDAVSRATISVTSAARAIRNSARRMATQLLVPPK
jgi:NosR/NirI family nitrous oxide reductase transcriptional regulator